MRKTFFSLLLISLCSPLSVYAAKFDYDVAITPGTLAFVPQEIYAGESIRIYVNIMNLGNKDITGVVGFYQGPNLLSAEVPFSLKAQSVTEDVWIDWVPIEGRYNVMVRIDPITPDQNPGNNVTITSMMTIAKRPLPPLPPPALVLTVQQQSVSPSPTPPSQPIQKAPSATESIAKKLAQTVVEKITPKLPINPSISALEKTKALLAKKKNQPTPVAEGSLTQEAPILTQQPSTTTQEEGSQKLVPVGALDTSGQPAVESAQDERSLTDGLPKAKTSDPARILLIIGIIVAVGSLMVGGYFFHKSNA